MTLPLEGVRVLAVEQYGAGPFGTQFLADQGPIDRVRELRGAECPNDRSIWQALAELGVAGILVIPVNAYFGIS